MTDSEKEETLEDYLNETLNKKTEAFIYQRELPFLSKDSLDYYFGNIAFIQYDNYWRSKDQWNIVLLSKCDSVDSLKNAFRMYCSDIDGYNEKYANIFRFGYLRCLFSETFNPFQETMKRLLSLNVVKPWLRKAIEFDTERKLVACFIDKTLVGIF